MSLSALYTLLQYILLYKTRTQFTAISSIITRECWGPNFFSWEFFELCILERLECTNFILYAYLHVAKFTVLRSRLPFVSSTYRLWRRSAPTGCYCSSHQPIQDIITGAPSLFQQHGTGWPSWHNLCTRRPTLIWYNTSKHWRRHLLKNLNVKRDLSFWSPLRTRVALSPMELHSITTKSTAVYQHLVVHGRWGCFCTARWDSWVVSEVTGTLRWRMDAQGAWSTCAPIYASQH